MRDDLQRRSRVQLLIFVGAVTMIVLGGGLGLNDLKAEPSALKLKKSEMTSRPILLAQARRGSQASQSKNSKNSKKTSATKNQVVELKQLSFEGTVQRPSAAYLLQRRKLKFRGVEPKKSFLPQIFKSVERSPF